MTEQRPSKKQFELLQFIEGFIKGNGYGPSYREIMRALDYKSVSTVAVHVDGLIACGYLRKRDHSARSLEIVSGHSGKAVEKSDTDEYKKWLVNQIEEKIRESQQASSEASSRKIQALLETLTVLNLDEERLRIERALATEA